MTRRPLKRLPIVSDHAVVRWLERINGMDVEAVRKLILSEGREKLIPHLQSGTLHLKSHGAVLKIESGRVVTVKRPDMEPGHRPCRASRRPGRRGEAG